MWLIRELVFFVKVMLKVKGRRLDPESDGAYRRMVGKDFEPAVKGLDRTVKPEALKGCKL